jgi:hypothetical protein
LFGFNGCSGFERKEERKRVRVEKKKTKQTKTRKKSTHSGHLGGWVIERRVVHNVKYIGHPGLYGT